MSAIPLSIAMKHTRADEDDAELLQTYLDAAEDYAAQFLNRRFYADPEALAQAILDGEAGDDPIVINPSITAACLLMLGHLYSNREEVVVGAITSRMPVGSQMLLTPYRVGMGV